MRLLSLEGNRQRLDGGAMFGNCPRPVWERWCPPDAQHRIELACRALLVQTDDGRNILFETGIGAFFEPTMRERYGVLETEHVLLASLRAAGLTPDAIDVVVLSHLHFDHAGGLLKPWAAGMPPSLAFARAYVVVSSAAWERARQPHARDRASFIPELQGLLAASGRVEVLDPDAPHSDVLGDGVRFHYSHGHTPGLLLSEVRTPRGGVTFMGDLIPGTPWVHLPITMGYDRYPELLIDEKEQMLRRAEEQHGWLFFTHDPRVAAARVQRDERGRFAPQEAIAQLDWNL